MPNNSCGISHAMPKGPSYHPGGGEPPSATMLGIEQRVHPEDEAGRETAGDAGTARAGPVHRGNDGRRELRHGGERQRADGGKARRVGRRWKNAYAPNNTPTIATRRIHRIGAGDDDALAHGRQRQRHSIGSTRSLLIIVDSATLATMTMPVAAEKPPR